MNSSCQVRVLTKVFKQLICQVANPCIQICSRWITVLITSWRIYSPDSQTRPCYIQVGLHRWESLWSSPQASSSERWLTHRLNIQYTCSRALEHIWKSLPEVGWWIPADIYTAEPAVPDIGGVTTIHDLTKEVTQAFPWKLPRWMERITE